MRNDVARKLAELKLEDIKTLVLAPGTSPQEIVEGRHLFEGMKTEGAYRGLIVNKSPRGNQIITVERDIRNGTGALLVHRINLRRYDQSTGRINWGSRCFPYFPNEQAYDVIDDELRRVSPLDIRTLCA